MAGLARRDLLRTLAVGGVAVTSGLVFGELPVNATEAANATQASAGSNLVMIIRHAEKPPDSGKPYGVTTDGEQDDHSLIVAGWSRAGALVELFAPANGTPPTGLVMPTGLVVPTAIYASGAGEQGQRPIQTVTPLADRMGIALNTDYGKGDESALAATISGLTGATLVCWEHGEIPDIISALGTVSPQPPDSWDSSRFDLVWTLTGGPSNWTFNQVPQLLLAGDSTDPID
jgi:hypothetical protein